MTRVPPTSMAVVGAGPAGLASVRAARELGYTGPITVIGAEQHPPYDRPPLSKDYLSGRCGLDDLWLQADEAADLECRWRFGERVTSFDAAERTLHLADGSTVSADLVVLATGSSARLLPELRGPNVLGLRSLPDADRLRELLRPGARVVVLGAGLIGTEVAATAVELGCQVSVLAREQHPLQSLLGPVVAEAVSGWHRERGVELLTRSALVGVEHADGGAPGESAVEGLWIEQVGERRLLPTDVVVVAVGGAPDTDWLDSSGLTLADGVVCDEVGGTSHPGVVAVGDCAAWWDGRLGRHYRAQHWSAAQERPVVALSAVLGRPPAKPKPYLHWFWSDQYNAKIQVAGYPTLAERVEVVDGDLSDPTAGAVVHYLRDDELIAVLCVSRPREFTRLRRSLTAVLGHLPPPPPAPDDDASPLSPSSPGTSRALDPQEIS